MKNPTRLQWSPQSWISWTSSVCRFALLSATLEPIHALEEASSPPNPDALTSSWGARTQLEERGVAPYAIFTTEVWGNASGGLENRAWWNGLLDFGVELDTARLGWWPGGTFLAQVNWVMNSHNNACFDDYTGGFNPVSGIMAGDQIRVFNLHYRHAWREEAVVLKLGQIAVDDDFMSSAYAATFLNSAFGAMPSQVGTPLATSSGNPPAFPIYSVAAPGLFFRVVPAEPIYTQLALAYGRPGFDERDNHGFDWVDQTPLELGLFWESGYRYTLGRLPATFRLGLSYHTGPVDDFSGSSSGDPPATTQTVPNFYLIHDLDLVTDREGNTSLGTFVRVGFTPEPDRSMIGLYADAGLVWFGPLPGREEDVAGIAVSYAKFGRDFRRATGPDGVAGNETVLELTYQARVTHWLTLQADAQFLFNPSVNPDSGARETATVLGLRTQISF